MNIVVLDGYTLNPGDLSWEGLEALGDCTIHDRTPPESVVSRAADAEIVLTNKTVLSRAVIERLPKLRFIGVLATGYNIVDLAAARDRGIPVSNVPTYGTASVAQMTFAHVLNLTLHVADHGHSVARGDWTRCPDFCYANYPLVELAGQTLGLVGFGRIGQAVAAVGLAFGMNVLAYDVARAAGLSQAACPSLAAGAGEGGADVSATSPTVRFVGLEELFRASDVVSLHCPLTAENRCLVNAQTLAWMKPTAVLVNTSRGPLVDDLALADALNAGRLAGAGLDVLGVEPPPADNPLLTAKNCCITPHIAWATSAARKRLLDTTVANVKAFLDGCPQNVVN